VSYGPYYPSCDSSRRSSAGSQCAQLPEELQLPPATSQRAPPVGTVLCVDQQLGRCASRISPELADPPGAVESGSMRTWSSSARGAGPRASRRSRRRRSSSSGLMVGGYAVEANHLATLLSALPRFGSTPLLRPHGPIPLPSGRATARSPPLMPPSAGLPPAWVPFFDHAS
jgi:hypothetical protein